MTNNKDYLSQEEIDALLRQTADDSYDDIPSGAGQDSFLSSLEKDALGEIGNITFGSAATALSTLLGKKVEITTPQVTVITRSDLEVEFPKPHVAVHVKYVDGFNGINLLVIKTRDAQVIADLMMGGDGTGQLNEDGLEEIAVSAVQEAMNQMMGSSATSMSTIFNRFVNISPPGIDMLNMSTGEGQNNLPPDDVLIKISFRLIIGDLIDSSIMQLLPVPFAKDMVTTLMGGTSMSEEMTPNSVYSNPSEPADFSLPPTPSAPEPAYHQPPAASDPTIYQIPAQQPPMHQQQPPMQQPPMYQQQPPMQQPPMYQLPPDAHYQQPPMQQPYTQPPAYGQQPPMYPPAPPHSPASYGGVSNRNVNVQPAQFSSFAPGGSVHADDGNLNLLLDIPLKVTVELGRTQKVIKDILEITQGSIIELDKLAGEPVDILVNNKLIAKGEVVVIDENFGVRVTDIINQHERLHKLQ